MKFSSEALLAVLVLGAVAYVAFTDHGKSLLKSVTNSRAPANVETRYTDDEVFSRLDERQQQEWLKAKADIKKAEADMRTAEFWSKRPRALNTLPGNIQGREQYGVDQREKAERTIQNAELTLQKLRNSCK